MKLLFDQNISFRLIKRILNIIKGTPIKIIWLRTGNTTTRNLEIILKSKVSLIKSFLKEDYGCLEIID